MNIQTIIEEIEKHKAIMAEARDNLDKFLSELEELKEDYDNAWNSLQDARDSLSEIV
jgi:chromosome segregation ATPase